MNPACFSITTASGRVSFCPAGGVQSVLARMDTVKYDNSLTSKPSLFQQKDREEFKYSKIKVFFLGAIKRCLASQQHCMYGECSGGI